MMPASLPTRRIRDDLSFLLTNRIPRRLATRFMGWFSRVEYPLVRDLSIGAWRLVDRRLNLHEAKKARFTSLHDCFVRELKDGARPIDSTPSVLVSPCDAIVGASGPIRGTQVFQAKGFPYTLEDLLCDRELVSRYRDGRFVTLRLTPSMYHRFHAPDECEIDEVLYISGDTWNVNPIALRRIERLYCRNERVVIPIRLAPGRESVALVAVAAILVASVHLEFLDRPLTLRYRGPNRITCAARLRRGEEMGHFAHGSTIIVFATAGFELCSSVREGAVVRMGEALLRHPDPALAHTS
jgi:phosphatidylserine decarboxylase